MTFEVIEIKTNGPQLHPEQVKAERKAEAKRKQRAELKAIVSAAIAQGFEFPVVGLHTFCVKKIGPNLVAVSSAVRNPKDKPDALRGKELAHLRYCAGNYIYLRLAKGTTIKKLFGFFQPLYVPRKGHSK